VEKTWKPHIAGHPRVARARGPRFLPSGLGVSLRASPRPSLTPVRLPDDSNGVFN